MNLRRIRQFVVLAEVLNFRRASELLHMAQPALTVSIQKLEAEIGVALFTRDNRGVALTSAGQAALLEAQRTLLHGERLVDIARATDAGAGGSLRVGFVGSTTYSILPKLVPRYLAKYPNVELVLREDTSTHIIQMLDEESLDVGLVRIPVSQASHAQLVLLESDEFVVALHRDNPLARQSLLHLSDLREQAFIMYRADWGPGLRAAAMMLCQVGGFLPRITQEGTQIHTLLALVGSGLGIAFVPSIMKRFATDDIVILPLADLQAGISIGLALAFRPDVESPAARRFRDLATNIFSAHQR